MKRKLMVTAAVVALIGGTTFAVAQQQEEKSAHPRLAQPNSIGRPAAARCSISRWRQVVRRRTRRRPKGNAMNACRRRRQAGSERTGSTHRPRRTAKPRRMRRRRSVITRRKMRRSQDRARTQENAQTQEHGNARKALPRPVLPAASPQLSETQRTQIKDIIVKDRNVARVDNVNFSIRSGGRAAHIHFAVLPVNIVRSSRNIAASTRDRRRSALDHRSELDVDRRHLAGVTAARFGKNRSPRRRRRGLYHSPEFS